jgi:hypothetical protein
MRQTGSMSIFTSKATEQKFGARPFDLNVWSGAMQELFVDLADAGRTAALNINNWMRNTNCWFFQSPSADS